MKPLVLEAGAAVAQRHHVRLLSPWPELVDQAAAGGLSDGRGVS